MDSLAAYETVLRDLHQKRREIDAAIAAIEALRPPQPLKASPEPAPAPVAFQNAAPARGRFAGMTIVEASKIVLEENGGPMHVSDILAVIKDGGVTVGSADPANTVGSILNRAARLSGQFRRVGRGTWALAEPKMDISPIEREMLRPFTRSDVVEME